MVLSGVDGWKDIKDLGDEKLACYPQPGRRGQWLICLDIDAVSGAGQGEVTGGRHGGGVHGLAEGQGQGSAVD